MKNIVGQLKKEKDTILSDLGLKSKPGDIIGLDLGLRYFRAVRARGSIKEIPLKDTLIKELAGLKDLASEMNISPDERVAINFRGEKLAIKRARIPSMPTEEIKEALRWELKEQVQFDIDKAKIGFDILGEKEQEDGSKKIELIAVVYMESEIEAKVKELKAIGLNVQSVLPSEFALFSYAKHFDLIPSQESVAIVDIGSLTTTITIIEKGKLGFTRAVAIGGDTITEAMTGVLVSDKGTVELSKEDAEKIKCEQGIPQDLRILSMMRPVLERLASQIKRSLEYCEHQFNTEPVKKIILAGNGSKLKGLKEYLSKEIDIETLDALPDIAEATGLALSSDSNLNMLPEKLKEEKKKTLKRISIRMISVIAGLLFLISYGLLSVKSINLKRDIEISKSHLETVRDIRVIKDKMIIFGSAVNTITSDAIETGKILKELSNIVFSSMMLDELVVKNGEPNLQISGTILKGEQLSEFMSNLEASPVFEKVKLIFSEKNEDYSGPVLDFEVTCNVTR